MDGRNRFFDLEVGKNVYGSHYHIREPESIPLEDVETFSEFASCAVKWREKHVQLNKVLMKRRVPSGTRVKDHLAAAMTPETMPDFCLSKTSSGAAEKERSGKSPCVARDLMNEVDWPWLFSFLRNQDLGSVRDVHLHCGTANSLHPCRYELCDTLITQVRGRTRFLLISPEHAFTGLYPYPVHHPYDRYSMVDFEADEDEIANLWPEFNAENVSGRECILEPGQALFVPEYFFVHAQDLDAETVRLNLRVSRGRRLRSEAAVPLEVSRLLEERAAALASVREVHHWLSVVAHGEESDWIDTATVAGHRRIKFVEGVYEEVESNLGKGAVPAFLQRVVDRRLMPTPWLNKKAFREPLYLLDKPFTLEDTRTELEKKFPEFFRRKLRQDGWQVADTVSTVPIPGYNMPADADYRTL